MGRGEEFLRAVKLLCMMLRWSVRAVHLPRTIEYFNGNYGLYVIDPLNVPLWWGMLRVGEAMHLCGERPDRI